MERRLTFDVTWGYGTGGLGVQSECLREVLYTLRGGTKQAPTSMWSGSAIYFASDDNSHERVMPRRCHCRGHRGVEVTAYHIVMTRTVSP